MRSGLIAWVLLGPVAIILLLGFLAEYGLSDAFLGIIAIILLVGYFGGLIKIGVQLSRNPATPFDMYFGEKGLSIKRSRIFGREYSGDWNGKVVRIRYEFGSGGIKPRLIAKIGPEKKIKIMEPASVKEINSWLS